MLKYFFTASSSSPPVSAICWLRLQGLQRVGTEGGFDIGKARFWGGVGVGNTALGRWGLDSHGVWGVRRLQRASTLFSGLRKCVAAHICCTIYGHAKVDARPS